MNLLSPRNFATTATQIHEANKAKGFWDDPRSNEESLMLVITELSEAVEADRKGWKAELSNEPYDESLWIDWFELQVKDSVDDELADAVIRLYDLAGFLGMNDMSEDWQPQLYASKSICGNIYGVVSCITNAHHPEESISRGIKSIRTIAGYYEIDLDTHVALKLRYNKTRVHKHGKAY